MSLTLPMSCMLCGIRRHFLLDLHQEVPDTNAGVCAAVSEKTSPVRLCISGPTNQRFEPQESGVDGEKFGGSARPTHRTEALNTRKAARPLFGRTALPIWGNHYPKLSEPLREILGPAVLSQALSSVRQNQCPNLRVDVTLNQRGAAFPSLVQRFY